MGNGIQRATESIWAGSLLLKGGQSADDQNDRETFWSWLFYDRDSKHRIALEARIDSEATVRVRTELLPERTHPRAPVGPVLIRIDSRESNQVRAKPPIAPGGGVELLRLGEDRLSVAGGISPKGFQMAVLSTRPTNPTADAENYNQVALLADGERRVETVMKEIEPNLSRLRYAKLPRTTAPLIFADVRLSPMKAKIANPERPKVHTMLVIGGRDMEAGNVSLRLHVKGNVGVKPKGEVMADILAAIKSRRA